MSQKCESFYSLSDFIIVKFLEYAYVGSPLFHRNRHAEASGVQLSFASLRFESEYDRACISVFSLH